MAFTYQGNIRGAVSASLFAASNITGSQTLVGESPTRAGMIFCNNTNQDAYVYYGTGASTTNRFTIVIHAHDEGPHTGGDMQYTMEPPIWAGHVSVVFRAAPTTGSLIVTELF